MRTILAAIDFSAASPAVVAQAKELAQKMRARVVLLNVIGPSRPEADLISGIIFDDLRLVDLQRKVAAAHLEKMAEKLRMSDVPATAKMDVGIAVERIVRLARLVRAAYVVIGSHGHGALYDLVLGSTTAGVVKHSTCPVVIVKTPRPKGYKRNGS